MINASHIEFVCFKMSVENKTLSQCTRKLTKTQVCPAKTQIRSDCSMIRVFPISMKNLLGYQQQRLWSGCPKVEANLNICWVQKSIWAASSEFGTYRLCEQWRFRRDCASAQSRQNLRCSLIQAVSQEEPSDRKPDPWPLWMAGHTQLNFVMTECSKTQIRLTGAHL